MINTKLIWIVLLIGSLIVSGCARNVSTKETVLTADFTLNFKQAPAPNIRYYIILSNTQTTVPQPISGEYFPTPGSLFNENDVFLQAKPTKLQHYYQTFFSSWQDYIVIDINGAGQPSSRLFSSNSQRFDANTTSSNRYIQTIGFVPFVLVVSDRTLRIRFSLKDMPWATNALYFQIATAKLTDGTESGTIQDIIDLPNLGIPVLNQAQIDLISDQEDTALGIDASADLLSWSVRIW
jgi:hypothetical protein